jgi:hypothetical protein
MLCTRCHHDVHRQGWGIAVRAGGVEFIPPPTIDPTGWPRPGGLAAITITNDVSDATNDVSDATNDVSDATNDGDPPPSHTRENSAQATPN